MKKTLLLTVFIAIAALSFAAITTITVDWSADVAGTTGAVSHGTFNFATGKFIICDYSVPAVRLANGSTGALTGETLSLTGLNLTGSLGIFSTCAGSDGVIYGGTNVDASGTAGANSLVRWASETATPTQQDPALFGTIGMIFPRVMDVIGTGLDTVVASAGVDSGQVSIMTTTNGTTFAVTDATPDLTGAAAPLISNMMKQGVALVPGMQKIYGLKADGAGDVAKLIKNGANWEADPAFTNPQGTAFENPSIVGYAPGHDAIFAIGYGNATADTLYVFDGATGAEITSAKTVLTGINVGTYGYGSIDLNEAAGVGYFAGRSGTAGQFICGKFSFTPFATPTPIFTPTPSVSPSPTPFALNATTPWGLYE